MSPEEMQVEVIKDNVEFSIAAWLDGEAKRHEEWFAKYGYESSADRAHYYRDAARGIRTGAWRA